MDNGSIILDIGKDAIVLLLKISAPVMIAGMVTGILISLFQALTQIQEATLTFIPKILVIFFVLLLSISYMSSNIVAFTHTIYDIMILPF